MVGQIRQISPKQATEFLLPKHYSGRVPSISLAYGWFFQKQIKAVVTFGKPASPSLCTGLCGAEQARNVYELNRLCREDDWEQPLSYFVGFVLRKLKERDWIIVSYSDTAMNHHGYVYQACNFIYTGCTKPRTDIYSGCRKHCRHYTEDDKSNPIRAYRSSKHRYVYFCTHSKKLKDRWMNELRYDIQPYPKGDNETYTLGQYMKTRLIDTRTGQLFEES